MNPKRESTWLQTAVHPQFPSLQRDLTVDVCIIGGGITGITAALLLQRAGKKVAILEAEKLCRGVTGYTTAHLTVALDTRWHELIKSFGKDKAMLALQSQRAAIEAIASIAAEEKLDCSLRYLPGYLYADDSVASASTSSKEEVEREFEAAQKFGLQVELLPSAPLPFRTSRALRFENQAQFHPLRYALPLAQKIAERGGFVHEDTRALQIEDGERCTVKTARGTVTAAQVLVCTHSPVNDKLLMQTKLFQYRSYVVTAPLSAPLEGLFWDTMDPYHYLRTQDGTLIAGGEDHKVGQEPDTTAPFSRLRQYVREHFGVATTGIEWSAQVVEPLDGLPYVGKNPAGKNVFIATGFSGNGMTGGTMSALLLSDLVCGRSNPWSELYEPSRLKPALAWIKENVDYPFHMVADRLRPGQVHSVDEVPRGEGRVLHQGGQWLAASRDANGELCVLSAICTHMGCHVGWNTAEKSWDCPCHGGRFSTDGEVLDGPALSPLKKL